MPIHAMRPITKNKHVFSWKYELSEAWASGAPASSYESNLTQMRISIDRAELQ